MNQGKGSQPDAATNADFRAIGTRKSARLKAERIAKGLPAVENPIVRAKKNPNSRALAMKAMCFSCQGGTSERLPDSGWRWAIGQLPCPRLSAPFLEALSGENGQKGRRCLQVARFLGLSSLYMEVMGTLRAHLPPVPLATLASAATPSAVGVFFNQQ